MDLKFNMQTKHGMQRESDKFQIQKQETRWKSKYEKNMWTQRVAASLR